MTSCAPLFTVKVKFPKPVQATVVVWLIVKEIGEPVAVPPALVKVFPVLGAEVFKYPLAEIENEEPGSNAAVSGTVAYPLYPTINGIDKVIKNVPPEPVVVMVLVPADKVTGLPVTVVVPEVTYPF